MGQRAYLTIRNGLLITNDLTVEREKPRLFLTGAFDVVNLGNTPADSFALDVVLHEPEDWNLLSVTQDATFDDEVNSKNRKVSIISGYRVGPGATYRAGFNIGAFAPVPDRSDPKKIVRLDLRLRYRDVLGDTHAEEWCWSIHVDFNKLGPTSCEPMRMW